MNFGIREQDELQIIKNMSELLVGEKMIKYDFGEESFIRSRIKDKDLSSLQGISRIKIPQCGSHHI